MKRIIIALFLACGLGWCGTAYGQEPAPLVPGLVYECTSPSGYTYTVGVGEGGGDTGIANCVLIGENPGPIYIDDQLMIEEDDPRWDCHTMGNGICGEDGAPPMREMGKDLTGMTIVQKVV